LPGTIIHDKPVHHLPPVIVLKEKQAMLEMSSRDFSFVGEKHVGHLYHLLEKLHIKPNLTQNGAISFLCVLDDRPEKIEKLALEASAFDAGDKGSVTTNNGHYNKGSRERQPERLAETATPETIQVLMK
jgi:aspartate kinase